MKTLVIGGSAWDTLIHVDEIKELKEDMMLWAKKTHESVGSTGAGKALCLDALGADVTLLTDIAFDEPGKKVLEFFEKTNVGIIPVYSDITTTHTNIMHGDGKRISLLTSTHSIEPEIPSNIDELIEGSDVVFLNINNFCRKYIPYIKKHKKLCVVDIHDYDPPNPYHQDFIDAADVITGSSVNIKEQWVFLEELITQGKKLAVLTSGSKGLKALDYENNRYEISGYNDFEYVDSNGAGDSFCAALVLECFNTKNMGKALEFANVVGGLACTSFDLFNLEVTRQDVYKILKKE